MRDWLHFWLLGVPIHELAVFMCPNVHNVDWAAVWWRSCCSLITSWHGLMVQYCCSRHTQTQLWNIDWGVPVTVHWTTDIYITRFPNSCVIIQWQFCLCFHSSVAQEGKDVIYQNDIIEIITTGVCHGSLVKFSPLLCSNTSATG